MRRIRARAAVIAVSLMAGSCFEPASQVCGTGDVCPRGYKCTTSGDACIPEESTCGNGHQDPEEACDNGDVRDRDGCSHDCRSNEQCGNGFKDVLLGEKCDDGNTDSGDGCSSNCLSVEGCGNTTLDPGEECEDQNLFDDDNCPSTCQVAVCGDGFVNDAGHREQCDDRGESVQCNANCSWTRCGDLIINRSAGEACDLGPVDTRTCTYLCRDSFCGDSYINGDAGEQCDDPSINMTNCPYGTPTCTACNVTCTGQRSLSGPYCGDQIVQPMSDGGTEACDNTTNGATACPYGTPTCNVCNSTCTSIVMRTGPYCGNLMLDPLPGDGGTDAGVELCDDFTVGMTSCSYGTPTCLVCNQTCTAMVMRSGPFCGDHAQDLLPDGGMEPCDDDTTGMTACSYGTSSCTACKADCSGTMSLTGPYCGNLMIDPLPGDGGTDAGVELCDDSTVGVTSCPYGTPTCLVCNETCTAMVTRLGSFCGDQVLDTVLPDGGSEQCDDNTTGMTSCAYGTPTCTVCRADCSGTTTVTGPYCGDGTTNGTEGCDDGNNSICGTCSAGCTQSQAIAAAVGRITTVGEGNLRDGETFTLDDGVLLRVFEFDTGLDGGTGDVVIPVPDMTSQNTVAGLVKTYIGSSGLTISTSGTGNTVNLTNTEPGSAGNKRITETVANTGFVVQGMDGGRAADCTAGTGCIIDDDCLETLSCLDAGAGLGKTCQ